MNAVSAVQAIAERQAFEAECEKLGVPANSDIAWKFWQARANLTGGALAAPEPKGDAILIKALKEIAEECNCCGTRSDLSAIALEALGDYELSHEAQFKAMNHRLGKIFGSPDKAHLAQPVAVPEGYRLVKLEPRPANCNGIGLGVCCGEECAHVKETAEYAAAAPSAQCCAIAYDDLYDVVRGTGYVTTRQTREICEKIIAALTAKVAS